MLLICIACAVECTDIAITPQKTKLNSTLCFFI